MSPQPVTTESMDLNSNYRQDDNDDEEYVWTLSEDLAKFAKKQLNEEPALRETCLVKMRAWVKRQARLSNCRTDNLFLLRFLRARKFNLEKACDNLENYLKMRSANPEWFTEIDPTIPNVEELCKTGFSLVLPDRDSENRRVLFSYVDKLDVNKHINSDVMKVNMAAIETLMEDEENQIRGVTYIFYCKDISLAHCSIWSAANAHTLFGSCEKSVAVRHSDINLVRTPFCLWAVVEFVKQLLSSKIRSRINLISTEEKLVNKFGSSMLPPEIGGSGPPLKVMAESWFCILLRNRSRLLSLDQHLMTKITSNIDSGNENVSLKPEPVSTGSFWSLIPGL